MEPPLLPLTGDREPVLDQDDPVLDQQSFEDRALPEEDPVLGRCAEPEHLLDPGAVVPTAVEQGHLARPRALLDVALEVPLCALSVTRLRKRDDPRDARVQVVGYPLD